MLRFGAPSTTVTSSTDVIARASPTTYSHIPFTVSPLSDSHRSSNCCFQQLLNRSSRLNCYCNKATAEAAESMAGSIASPSGSKQALISLSDKKDLDILGTGLQELGYTIVSTGGTASALEKAGVSVTKVEELTQFPEMLDGRVKTLHPNIHGGILARRDQSHHMEALDKHNISTFEVVVVNLYPFYAKVSSSNGFTFNDAIENIDIGGPTMIRAAAKIYSTPMDLNGLLNNRSFLNDLNEPIYDLTLSQYQYNDSNSALPMYAESPLPTYVDCEERQLDEDNEDTLYARGTKKGQRADNFDNEEDKLLVSAWLNTSLDAVKGNDQKKSQFWKRITNYYAENKTWDKDRSEKSLISRWTKISSIVSRFCAIHSQIEHLRRSGYTEQDKIVEAKEVFRKEEGHSFQLDHCWVILRFQHKWMNEQKKIAEKKKSRTHSTKTPNSINLDDNNVEAPEPASLKRPIGRKAAKEMSKKAKTKGASENDNELSKVRLELEELRARRLESERIRAEQFQLLLANEQKHIELKEKKLEVQAQIEEDRVMAMDTNGMSPTRVEYFKRRRKEIFAKQGGMFENI